MFLSKVWIDWHWSKNPYQLHRALWQLFPDRPDDRRDFLFRVEQSQPGRGAGVLLQSAEAPTAVAVVQIVASKVIQPSISVGARLRFKIRANPIKTIKDERQRLNQNNKIKSCRVPLIHEEEQLNWLSRKLNNAAMLETTIMTPELPLYFRKSDMSGKIQPVVFEGLLTVQSADLLALLLNRGIGPGKAMGCGLLSLAPG